MLEERVLKQLGLTSLTVHDLEAGKAKYAELEKEIEGLKAEQAKFDAERNELLERRKQEVEKLGEEKQRLDDKVEQAKEEFEMATYIQDHRQDEYRFAVDEADYKTGRSEKVNRILEIMKQKAQDAANAKDIAAARLRVAESERAEATKEINKIDQEYRRIDKQYSRIDKQLTQLSYLSSQLFWELDRLERNKEYFLNKEK
ncbi:MAG: hypothetical protein IKE21_00405 [Erysipelotrichaceae bacterium]|nr:hypothetical protein [Erysipelotrichaceae bacterium]